MTKSDEITVQFVLRKGDGEWPKLQELSNEEAKDLTRIGRFFLDLDDQNNILTNNHIREIEFIYDGVSLLHGTQLGLRTLDGRLFGYPSPVLKFKLQTSVCSTAFIETVWHSFILLKPGSRSNREGFSCEDHQGYTYALDEVAVRNLTKAVQQSSSLQYRPVSVSELQSGVHLYEIKVL